MVLGGFRSFHVLVTTASEPPLDLVQVLRRNVCYTTVMYRICDFGSIVSCLKIKLSALDIMEVALKIHSDLTYYSSDFNLSYIVSRAKFLLFEGFLPIS